MKDNWCQYLGKEGKDCIELFDKLDFSKFLQDDDVADIKDIIDDIEIYYGTDFEDITGGLLFNLFNTLEIIEYLEDRYEIRFIEHVTYLKVGTGEKKNK
ncbi:MAG: hypothetical protein E7167_01995 [Firmicutes bacterium]|nr:hypothetical protein [Bacillota bacterium]